MFVPASIPKGISTRKTTSRSDWGKVNTKTIDLVVSSCVIAIANGELILIKFTTGS